jgi:RNA polymerase sigma-70 factor (ECF subfamily)
MSCCCSAARRATGRQEAWVAIVRNLRHLRDPATFHPWALRIVHGKSIDWIRRTSRRRAGAQALAEETPPAADELAVEPAASSKPLMDLRRVSPVQRALLSMFYFEELTTREIAEALAIPEGTVKSRLFHLRKQLKELMEAEP